jgi:hypothetical protein
LEARKLESIKAWRPGSWKAGMACRDGIRAAMTATAMALIIGVRCSAAADQGVEVLNPDTCRRSRLKRSASGEH